MADSPHVVMMAGPNGSGRSTLIAALRADPNGRLPALYVNAEDLQRERGLTNAAAEMLAAELRARALQAREDVTYETVMSHPSKLAAAARAEGTVWLDAVRPVATAGCERWARWVMRYLIPSRRSVPPKVECSIWSTSGRRGLCHEAIEFIEHVRDRLLRAWLEPVARCGLLEATLPVSGAGQYADKV